MTEKTNNKNEDILAGLIVLTSGYGYSLITVKVIEAFYQNFFWENIIVSIVICIFSFAAYLLIGVFLGSRAENISKLLFNSYIISILVLFIYSVAMLIYAAGKGYDSYIAPILVTHLGNVGRRIDVVTGIFIVMIISSAAVYRMRCRRRLTYGVIELIIGFVQTFLASSTAFNFLFSSSSSEADNGFSKAMLQIIAGMYIIVRGLDNMEQAANAEKDSPVKVRISFFFKRAFRDPLSQIFKQAD